MRLFRKVEDGTYTEVKTTERLVNVSDGVEVARKHGGGDGNFVADFGNGEVLDFTMTDRQPGPLLRENVRNLPDTQLPSYLADQALPDATKNSVGVFGAFFDDQRSGNASWDPSVNASEDVAGTTDSE